MLACTRSTFCGEAQALTNSATEIDVNTLIEEDMNEVVALFLAVVIRNISLMDCTLWYDVQSRLKPEYYHFHRVKVDC